MLALFLASALAAEPEAPRRDALAGVDVGGSFGAGLFVEGTGWIEPDGRLTVWPSWGGPWATFSADFAWHGLVASGGAWAGPMAVGEYDWVTLLPGGVDAALGFGVRILSVQAYLTGPFWAYGGRIVARPFRTERGSHIGLEIRGAASFMGGAVGVAYSISPAPSDSGGHFYLRKPRRP